MSYTIKLTNGATLTTLIDGVIDQTTTDLTLISKNATGYGAFLNDNFIWLLENFANTSQPNKPVIGQLWYDTSQNILQVYNGTSFTPTGNTIVASSIPSSLTTGGLWINNSSGQLYFNDGSETTLAGPIYTKNQGVSGFQVEDVIDTNNISHTIVLLYVAQTLIGIFSKDSFVPSTAIPGYTGTINVGFNAGSYNGIAFDTIASEANALVAADGSLKTPESFVSTTDSSATSGTLSIQNSTPLILGSAASTEFNVSTSLFQIQSNSSNQNFEISTLAGSTLSPAVFINSTTKHVGIFTSTPQATLDVNGSVIIEGNLTVNGTTTSTNTATVNLADYTITLADTQSPSDSTANGAGLIVAGSSNKTFQWQQSNAAWLSSENMNLATGKTYKVNGFDVLTGSALGSVITSAPGLTSIGTLTSLSVANLSFTGSTITATTSNANVNLVANGTGTVDVGSSRITSVATPTTGTDATTKTYVDTKVQSAPLAIALTTTGFTNAQIGSRHLSVMFPNTEHPDGTICRTFCTDLGTTVTVNAGSFQTGIAYMIVSSGSTNFTLIGSNDNNVGTIFVATGPGSGSGTASPVRRQFALVSGTWTFQSYI